MNLTEKKAIEWWKKYQAKVGESQACSEYTWISWEIERGRKFKIIDEGHDFEKEAIVELYRRKK